MDMGVTKDTNTIIFFSSQKEKTRKIHSLRGKVSAILSADEKQEIYELLAQEYDICKSSYDELCEITEVLYECGVITSGERAIIIFNPEIAPPDFIKAKYPNYRYFITETDRAGRRDWLLEFAARIKKNNATGNPHGAAYRQKLLDILRKLERK